MYLVLPVTTVNFPLRVQSMADMANYICTLILEDSFPEYSEYDQKVRVQFLDGEEADSEEKDDSSDSASDEDDEDEDEEEREEEVVETYKEQVDENVDRNSQHVSPIRVIRPV